MKILDEDKLPFPFCPGCGHSKITQTIANALEALNYSPEQVAIVTDIGCCGIIDRYFNTHTFHGLHGRAITYATGLKLANPALKVITVMGDGGVGIGAGHLVAAAKRNIGITVIVYNNFNFGMTGGQHSLTTPYAAITSSTEYGNIERPLDICKLVEVCGANWVTRTIVYDSRMPELVKETISQKGFALIDIWDICTAYFARRNKIDKKKLEELYSKYGQGVICNRDYLEYTELYQKEIVEKVKNRETKNIFLEKKFDHNLKRRVKIIIAGSAGQRIRTCATILALAGIISGLYSTQKDNFPITVMTGHSLSEVILDHKEILYAGIDVPDYMLIISQDGLDYVRKIIKRMPETSTIFIDSSLSCPETTAQVTKIELAKIATQVGRPYIGLAFVADFLKRVPLISIDALREGAKATLLPEAVNMGLQAIDVAYSVL